MHPGIFTLLLFVLVLLVAAGEQELRYRKQRQAAKEQRDARRRTHGPRVLP